MKNEDILWVSPNGSDGELGTFEQPFGDLSAALNRLRPGQIITLKSGTYSSDITIQQSGSRDHPIRIRAEKEQTVEIAGACWYLYDVSDCIISGLAFRNAPAVALSVVGACECNRFEKLRFINCGLKNRESCTMFFGGSGSRCNIVEDCEFLRDSPQKPPAISSGIASVGLMITEGDLDGNAPNKDFIIRTCSFSNYDYGILAGSRDHATGQYSHCIEYNRITSCTIAGIAARCGDTTIRENCIEHIRHAGIAVMAGVSSFIGDNRISACETGVQVAGKGHTIANNCIFRCRSAVHVAAKSGPETAAAVAIVIERNTIVDYGDASQIQSTVPPEGIQIDAGTSCVIEENLFYGTTRPYDSAVQKAEPARHLPLFARNNLISKYSGTIEGCISAEVAFSSYETDVFTNSSGYGASGRVLTGDPYEPDPGESSKDMAEGQDDDDAIGIEYADDEEQPDEGNPSFDIKAFFTGEGLEAEISMDEARDKPNLN